MNQQIAEVVDRLVFDHGALDPVDCLLALGMIDPADANCWRHTPAPDRLLCSVAEAVAALAQAQDYAGRQGLCAVALPEHDQATGTGDDAKTLALLCRRLLHRPHNRSQGDLFQDSAPAMAAGRLGDALAVQDQARAHAELAKLRTVAASCEDRSAAADFARLIAALDCDYDDAKARVRKLETQIEPRAGARMSSGRAIALSRALWADVAQRLADCLFCPAAPHAHASYAFLRAAEWDSVRASVRSIPDWTAYPVLYVRLAQANSQLHRLAMARTVWTRLCWNHPSVAGEHLAQAPGDPALARRWADFDASTLELTAADFPSWLLLADPRQRDFVPAAWAPGSQAGRAYSVLCELIHSRGEFNARRRLQRVRPDLLALYLARANAKTPG